MAELRDGEEAVPLSVPMLRAVVGPAPVVVAVLLADIPDELFSHIVVVGVVPVVPSPPTIIIVEGDSKVVARWEWVISLLDSSTVLIELCAVLLFGLLKTFSWFSLGAVIASLPSNAIMVPARISEMWIMDCCPVIL